jgi:hypothetical protein
VPAHSCDLVDGLAGVGESRQRRLAQTVKRAALRQGGVIAPLAELLVNMFEPTC